MFRRGSSSKTFGDIPFVVFYHTVLARIAYFTSVNFIQSYIDIFGLIIPVNLMQSINNAPFDETIFKSSIYNLDKYPDIPVYMNGKEKMVDFTKMAEQINDVTSKRSSNEWGGETVISIGSEKIAYVSISTSNYGGYYILVDTRMPNSIFVVFRGTYSAKSAGSYTKPNSLIPTKIGQDIPQQQLQAKLQMDQGKMYGVLIGIEKILDDVYHTIIESMLFLSKTYLKANAPGSVKVFTTGHSLGGGLCTLFTNNWYELVRVAPYNKAPYNIFNQKICCISIASPRVMSPALSNNFCGKVEKGLILYRRLTNRGDPVPALPNKSVIGLSEGFQHPCSAKKYAKTQRGVISMDCSNALKARPTVKTDYSVALNCKNTKTMLSLSANPLAHTSYLYINFVTAVPVSEFLMSSMPSMVKKRITEIERTNKGATVARMIIGSTVTSKKLEFKSTYFTLNSLRQKDKQIANVDPNHPPSLSSDSLMDTQAFKQILSQMKVIPSGTSLNQVKFNELSNIQPTGSVKPDIDGLMGKTGGKKTRRCTRKRKSRKRQTKKRRSTRRRR